MREKIDGSDRAVRTHRIVERVEDQLLNRAGGDPGLLLHLVGLRRTLLFDLGENQLPAAQLLQVNDLFLSHTHIDHFVGFDRLLRCLLGHTTRVRIFGPPGLIRSVKGKLDAYLWNLSFQQNLEFEVHELGHDRIRRTRYSLLDRFQEGVELGALPLRSAAGTRRGPPGPGTGAFVLLDEDGFSVSCALVDHGTPCLAFVLVQAERFRFSPEGLEAAGLGPGPVLGELKARILAGKVPRREAELLGSWVPGRRIAYLTDCGFNPRTVRGALAVAQGADVLYCEATFPNREADKAGRVHHLTGGQAGALAREAGVARVVPFHFSRRFSREPGEILQDVSEAFSNEGRFSEMIQSWLEEPVG